VAAQGTEWSHQRGWNPLQQPGNSPGQELLRSRRWPFHHGITAHHEPHPGDSPGAGSLPWPGLLTSLSRRGCPPAKTSKIDSSRKLISLGDTLGLGWVTVAGWCALPVLLQPKTRCSHTLRCNALH
jgi:hypothetical protein